MDKEVIKKYKKEFDHWLDDGAIWVKYKLPNDTTVWIRRHPKNDVSVKWDEAYYTKNGAEIAYAIDDEYVELRKASADGKIIQHNIGNLGVWHVHTASMSFNDPLTFEDGTPCYRIKPDEPEFKVGDYVYYSSENRILKIIPTEQVLNYQGSMYTTLYAARNNRCMTKWEPKEGDVVIAWYDKGGGSGTTHKVIDVVTLRSGGLMLLNCHWFLGKDTNNVIPYIGQDFKDMV